MYQDITLKCKDCGEAFVFTVGEQEFYAEKGFPNQPTRCKPCRDSKKAAKTSAPKESFVAVCARCGGEAKLPFQPTTDRPVYCSDCFAETKKR